MFVQAFRNISFKVGTVDPAGDFEKLIERADIKKFKEGSCGSYHHGKSVFLL